MGVRNGEDRVNGPTNPPLVGRWDSNVGKLNTTFFKPKGGFFLFSLTLNYKWLQSRAGKDVDKIKGIIICTGLIGNGLKCSEISFLKPPIKILMT